MKVAVIVLSYNSRDYISSCLESLQKLVLGDTQLEIVVVDNASADDTGTFVKSKFPEITVLVNPQNLGYADGNNVGIRYALAQNHDFIWIVNPDIAVDRNALSELMFAATRYPGAGIFGPKIYFAPGYEFHKDRYTKADLGKVIWYAGGQMDWDNIQSLHRGVDEVDKGQFNRDVEVDFITGACMFLRRQLFDSVGLFDPQYFLYFEENDLCQRTMKVGWKLMYIAKSIAWHANAQATGIGSGLQDYYLTRNRLLFGLKYGGFYTKLLLLKDSARLYFNGRPWQRRAIADFYHKKLGAGSFQP